MIETADKKVLMATNAIGAMTNVTIYWQVDYASVGGVLLFFPLANEANNYSVEFNDDSLTMRIATGPAGTSGVYTGRWRWPITPGRHRIGIRYNFDANQSNPPVCFVNGVPITPIESVAPTQKYNHPLREVFVGGNRGGYMSLYDAHSFNGSVSEIAVCGQMHSDAIMARYTNPATPKGALRFAPGVLHYWPCDEVRDGQTGVQEIFTYPAGDVNTLWSVKTHGTYWQSVRHDDSNYMQAIQGDANEDQRMWFYSPTFVKPAGTEVIAVGVTIKCNNPDEDEQVFVVSVKKGATWHAMPFATSFPSGGSPPTKEAVFTRSVGWGDWSQTELNNIQAGFLSGSMSGKDDTITISQVYITAYCGDWTTQFRDYIGGNHLVNRNAVGRPERMLSYL